MADISDIDTPLDPPPAEATDVPTFPDPPPAEPFDIATSPDPPPALPFPVEAPGDPGPLPPFDVPVLADPGPVEPHDVDVSPDPGPAPAIDVATAPSGGPWAPVDPATAADPPPAAPVDVAAPGDPAPADPQDVPTSASPAPAEPHDVPVRRDPGPGIFIPIPDPSRSPPPAEPGSPGAYAARMRGIDESVFALLEAAAGVDVPGAAVPGALALDPLALAGWWRGYVAQVGPAGVADFLATQALLYSQNAVVNKIFNPGYIALMSLPTPPGTLRTTLDGITINDVIDAQELLRPRSLPDTPGAEQNSYSALNPMSERQDFDVGEMVDAAAGGGSHPYLATTDVAGVPTARFDPAKMFVRTNDGGSRWLRDVQGKAAATDVRGTRLARGASTDGIVPVRFPGEDPDGAVRTDDDGLLTAIDDDDAYLPLSFTDLRRDGFGRFRSVYFRALNLRVAESLAPEFEEMGAFGRTDPIVGYARTVRSFNISFDAHCFAAEDLSVMHSKLNWLRAMAYPSFTADALFNSGPVVQLRVGELVAAGGGRGLTGILRGIDFDFGDALWELRRAAKLPRSVNVSVSFLALHRGPVGTAGGDFGVLRLPRLGEETGDTNFADIEVDAITGAG